jgi:GT2 family glycosyltransferase
MTELISGPPHTTPASGSGGSAVSARPHVTAVVVAHDGAPWLPRCLDALAGQGADVVVAVDTGSRDDSLPLLRQAVGHDHVVVVDRRTGFGDAVRQGLAHAASLLGDRPADEQHWYWLLHDDCAPQPGALEALLDTAARSRHVGVVGPKLVDWDDPTRLLEVGLTVSRGGRRWAGVEAAERDQGQHDDVTDVLALGTAGLLVRADVWAELDGLDPRLPLFRDDVDLGWRAHLAGHRVVLAPRARVADAQASTRGARSVDAVRGPVRRVDRVHALRVALARCSLWMVLPLLVWLTLAGVARSVGLLAAKAPGRSLDELLATLVALTTPWRWIASRWRARGTVRLRRRDIAQLLLPRRAGVRRAVDALGVLAARDADEQASAAAPPAEPGPTSDEADVVVAAPRVWLRRLVTHPLTLVVLALSVVTAAAWRGLGDLLGQPTLSGGELARLTGRPGDLWHAAFAGWSGSGLGTDVVASPADVVRAAAVTALEPLAGSHAAAVAVLLLLLLAPVLSAVSAYLALTGFVRSRWVRAWAGAAWATLPVVATAVAAGRLGAVAALVLLSLVVAAFVRALAPRGAGSTTAAFAGSLGAALLVTAVPALLVVPLGLLGPWLGAVVDEPRRLLTGPGLLAPAAPTHGVTTWFSPDALAGLEPLLRAPAGVPVWVVLAAAAPVVLAGLLGLLRAGGRGRVLLGLWALGLLGVAAALLAPSVVLARTDTGGLGPWAGSPLLLVGLAAIGSAAVAVDGLARRLAVHRFGWRQLLVAPVVAVAVLGPVAGGTLWAWRGVAGPLQPSATATLPAVVLAAAEGPAGVRTLELRTGTGSSVGYRLDGVEPGSWTRDLPLGDPTSGADATVDPVREVVRDLVDGAAGGTSASSSVEQLGRLAVGFVLVRGDAPTTLVTRLDATAGLARLGAPSGSMLWRVGTGGIGTGGTGLATTRQERPARVRVETPDGAVLQTIPVSGAHAEAHVALVHAGTSAEATTPRLLVLSQPASPRWQATLDGQALQPVRPQEGEWRQAFLLPDRSGDLLVRYDRLNQRWWQLGQGVLAALTVLLALPVRRPSDPTEADEPTATEAEPTATEAEPTAPAAPRVDVPSIELRGNDEDDELWTATIRPARRATEESA